MPEWLKERDHTLLPKIDSVLVSGIASSKTQLVVTGTGLRAYPQVFESYRALGNAVIDIFTNSADFEGSSLLRAPSNFPGMLLKVDPFLESVETLMTLAALERLLPRSTKSFQFEPVRLFWALGNGENMDLIFMEKAAGQRKPGFGMKGAGAYSDACISLNDELKASSVSAFAGGNDVIYRGLNPAGIPILTLVDQCDHNILEKLLAPGVGK